MPEYIVRGGRTLPENPARCLSWINTRKLKNAADRNVDYCFSYTIYGIEYRYSFPARDLLHAFKQKGVQQHRYGRSVSWAFFVEYSTGRIFTGSPEYFDQVVVNLNSSDRPYEYDAEDSEELSEIDYAPALLRACSDSKVELVEWLLVAGADANGDGRNYGHDYSQPIWVALSDGGGEDSSLKIIRTLLEYKADVNAVNDEGNTPLYSAIESGSKKLVKLLLDYGAEVNMVTAFGTPYEWAEECGEEQIMELLLEYGAEDEG